ncbi:MAG: hypothetical protein ACP5HW_02040 [Candidatus Micrarchaeia archaeon]
MPKVIEEGRREILKLEMLKYLSVNGRASIDDIARHIKMPKATTYALFNELVKEYRLHFVPEININDIWKFEFIKISKHKSTKREIKEEALEKIPELGLEEYISFVKFNGAVPSEEEILNVIKNFAEPQYVAKLHGGDDLVIYEVGKSFYNVNKFIINFSKSLKKYNMIINTSRIVTESGFFPLRNELLDTLMLPDTSKALLEGLNIDARGEIKEIAKRFNKKPELLLYAMDRLKHGGLLERLTYFEAQPKNNIGGIIKIVITNESKFIESKNKFLLELVKQKEGEHTRYTYICDIMNPSGILIFVNLASNEEIDSIISNLSKVLKGVEIEYTTITKSIFGNLGIRNFDMRYSVQYKVLESENLVLKVNRREL